MDIEDSSNRTKKITRRFLFAYALLIPFGFLSEIPFDGLGFLLIFWSLLQSIVYGALFLFSARLLEKDSLVGYLLPAITLFVSQTNLVNYSIFNSNLSKSISDISLIDAVVIVGVLLSILITKGLWNHLIRENGSLIITKITITIVVVILSLPLWISKLV